MAVRWYDVEVDTPLPSWKEKHQKLHFGVSMLQSYNAQLEKLNRNKLQS